MGKVYNRLKLLLTFSILTVAISLAAQAPDTYYPKPDQIFQTTSINLAWNASTDALSYTVQYANNPSFTAPTTVNSIAGTTLAIGPLATGKYYYWRVRTVRASGTSAWSASYKFGVFLPNNFTGLQFWVSADGSMVRDVNNLVSQWTDMSGNNNNVSQPNSNEQPVYQTNALNGYPSVKFDGTNDYLNGGDILDGGFNSQSIFFIGRSNTSEGAYISKSRASNVIRRFSFVYTGGSILGPLWHDVAEINNVVTKPAGRTELVSFATKRDTTAPYYNTRFFNIDGAGTSSTKYNIQGSSYDMNSTYRFLIGAYNNSSDNGQILLLNGFMSEIVVYNTAFSDSVRKLVEQMIMDKYAPPVNLGPDIVLADNFCDTTIKAGKYFVKYAWSTGLTSSIDSNLVASNAGMYKVTATDIFGRTSVDSILIVKPDPNYTGSPIFCLNDSALWNTSLSNTLYNFTWSQGGTDSFIYISTPGSYRVTVTDLNGCSRVSNLVAFSVDSFGLKIGLTNAPDTSLCTANLFGLNKGANLVQSYLWSTGATTPLIEADTPGVYKVTVTNSIGCAGYDSVTVIILGEGPTPNFTATSACFGAANSFTDLSTIPLPNTVAGWKWTFGDGDTSILQSPTHTYADTGTYNVTLLATSSLGCQSSTITKPVRVYPNPTAFFNDSAGCINAAIPFKSRSTAPAGTTITNWLWDFGNSSTSPLQNPSYTYNAAGQYTVTLTVTTSQGCQHTYSRLVNVVSSAPTPGSITLLQPATGTNHTGASVNFSWQASANAYAYILEVSTTSNFSNIIYTTTTPNLSVSVTSIPASLSAYYWRVKAQNICGLGVTSSSRTFYKISPLDLPNLVFWVSGDGPHIKNSSNFVSDWFDRSTANNNVYQLTGVKQPRWVDSLAKINYMPAIKFSGGNVLEGGDILDLRTKSRTIIIVGQMNANTPDGSYVAKALQAQRDKRFAIIRAASQLAHVYVENTDKSIQTFTNYGDFEVVIAQTNRNSREINLQRNYGTTYTGLNIQGSSYDFDSDFRFLVGAYNSSNDFSEVLGLNGHIAEVIIFDTVLSPSQLVAMKTYLDSKYTKPVDLGPDINIPYGYCNQITLDASERYKNYVWNTGDTTSTLDITVAGTYSVTVTDVFGNVTTDAVVVNIPSLLAPPRTTFCDQDSIIWNADQGPSYSYLWSTGDTTPLLVIKQSGQVTLTITDTIPPAQGGPCSISTTYNFVSDSFSVLTTLGPDTTICGNAYIGLNSNAQNVVAYNWSTNSTSPTIQVNNAGTYWVNVLNATGCQASDTINVSLSGRLANVNFTAPTALCFGDTTYFNDQSTIQAPFNITNYYWDFGNGDTSSAQSPRYYFDALGLYTVELIVVADSGCTSSISKTVQVFDKPTAKFSYKIGCAGSPISFADQSVGVANDALAQWMWSFGDDSTSSLRNPNHIYSQPGIYPVSLTVLSNTGCSSVFYDTLEVFPELFVAIETNNLCFGETTQFMDASPGFSNISWLWEFGANNDISTQQNPTYNYTQTGSFLIKLTVKNALGCEAAAFDTISIVQPPTANFTYNVACEDYNFRLNDASTIAGNDSIVKWFWEFNDGGLPSNAPNPVRTYDTVGTINVTLSIESANGCPATVTKPVTIAPAPTASFTFTPDYGAAPLPVTYTNTSVGAVTYQWFFSDGSYSEDENPVHTFPYNSEFNTVMIATGPGGCKDTATSELLVNIATLDIAVVEVNVQNVNGRVRPSATIINQGTRNVDHYFLTSTLGDGSRITERVDTFLASGTGMVYNFVAGYEATEFQASSFLCIQASQPNDEVDDNALNDRLCKPLENDIRIVPPYPNPANNNITFEVLMPREALLEIDMYDVLGHELMTIYDAMAPKGTQTFKLDLTGYPRGVYIIKIRFNDTDDYIMKFVAE